MFYLLSLLENLTSLWPCLAVLALVALVVIFGAPKVFARTTVYSVGSFIAIAALLVVYFNLRGGLNLYGMMGFAILLFFLGLGAVGFFLFYTVFVGVRTKTYRRFPRSIRISFVWLCIVACLFFVLSETNLIGRQIEKINDDFWATCKEGSAQHIADVIKSGANMHAQNKQGKTLLMWTAGSNPDPEAITTLIKAGSDVSAKDKDGNTPLMWATKNNPNPKIITTLVKAGADVNVRNKNGSTPLMIAAAYINARNEDVITSLIVDRSENDAK